MCFSHPLESGGIRSLNIIFSFNWLCQLGHLILGVFISKDLLVDKVDINFQILCEASHQDNVDRKPLAGGGMQCRVLSRGSDAPLQLISHSWASTSAAHVITCLTSFFPQCINSMKAVTWLFCSLLSPTAVTLPGSETPGRVVELMTTLIVRHPSECLFPFPHSDS